MSLLSAGYLWGLLALLPLAAVFFLKVRPRKKRTNAFFLWQKVFEEKKASALFRKLRDVLSLLLVLIAATLIILALTEPQIDSGDDGKDVLLVIDVSASMAAGEVGERGFDLAKKRAQEIIAAMNGTRRVSIASLSNQLEFVSHFSDSPRDLSRAVNRLRVKSLPVSQEVCKVLEQYGEVSDQFRVILLTDGRGAVGHLSDKVEIMPIKKEVKNAGLVQVDFDWIPGKPGTVGFYYRVSSSYSESKHAELELQNKSTGELARLIPLKMEPGLSEPAVIEVSDAKPGEWEAILHVADDFPQDNKVEMILAESTTIPVRVQTNTGRYFYQRSVEAFTLAGGILRTLSSGIGDVMVSHGMPDGEEPALIFAPSGEAPWWQAVGDEQEVLVAESKVEEHPLLRHIDLEGMRFKGARKLEAPEGAVVLVTSEAGLPLIYKMEHEGRSAVVVNLDPNQGEFFLSPWFPVLVHDAARHLVQRENDWRSVYPVGSTIDIPGGAQLETPDGVVHAAGKYMLDEVGRFFIRQGERESSFAVSLLNEGESLFHEENIVKSVEPIDQGNPLASWLIALALVILVVESVLYHRRKVG